ncbi:DsbA family oxidoreductase [Thiolapillus sp.]|uniref:DsbA family oxidoreductase n=2 Tax=Thiolapillus sp. TaxID=2017437 RepID=UPI0025DBA16B|nr:DsbA family protein [Thiolapillus sp.]
MQDRIEIDYYTDMLCVWAYFAQIKLDELKQEFGDRIRIRHHFITLFGNNEIRIAQGYADGGYAGYSAHVRGLQQHFPHVDIHPQIWTRNIPASSMPVHLTLKAVQLLEKRGGLPRPAGAPRTLFEELVWQLRLAFFSKLQNIADESVLHGHLEALGIPVDEVEAEISNGNAHAALSLDMDDHRNRMIEGSPTWIMNEGRQRLYGNVGYRAIAANIQELLEREVDLPDWC